MNLNCCAFSLLTGLVLTASAEPIRWFDGTWDPSGAPKGKLLSDNPKWFGPKIFTGCSYEWLEAPTFPMDIAGENRKKPAQRLIGGQTRIIEWDTVGRPGDKPIVAVFDFKRPCSFTEVDLVSERCTNAQATVEFSDDKTNWAGRVSQEVAGPLSRLRLADGKRGRYLKLSFQALPQAENTWWKKTKGYSFLDEVLVWGDGEVSSACPEDVADIPAGDSLAFTNAAKGTVSILPMPIPHLSRKPGGVTPGKVSLRLAKNETESRYFAVVNGTGRPVTLSLCKPEFGPGLTTELLIGGVVRMSPPKRKLSDREMVQLHTNDRDGINKGSAEDLDVLPFFFPHVIPEPNCRRNYLANPGQVAGFPEAVPLEVGEGCVVMLRIISDGASAGSRRGSLSAGAARLPVEVVVVDLTLPRQKMWICAYEPFTSQYPYETAARVRRDVKRYVEVGATNTQELPEQDTKEELFFKLADNPSVGFWLERMKAGNAAFRKIAHKGDFSKCTAAELKELSDAAREIYERGRRLGLRREQLIAFLPDEPGPSNGAAVMSLARYLKQQAPELMLHCDPLCYKGGSDFCASEDILKLFGDTYRDCVDVSCPIDCISGRPELMEKLWGAKRFVNAQYNHPAGRTGPHMAYDSYRKGYNGFAYYCYYHPNGRDPWDIRTWGVLNYNYQTVFPLEGDVALTPLYEFLREGAELCRLLDAVKSSGRKELYDSILARSKNAWDRTHFQYDLQDPSKEDMLSLRDDMLKAFGQDGH